MSIVLFAIMGASINAGVWYWICFGGYCLHWLIVLIGNIIKGLNE